jgi:two-component system sensor histidine kinase/response regulator
MQNIFIVEEDDLLRSNIVELLQAENYYTYEASNCSEAIEKIGLVRPDLIVSEALFPKGNGVELLEHVRNSSELENTPFIFLTGRPDYLDYRTGMNRGADDYFVKPFKSTDLLDSIKTRLAKKKQVSTEIDTLKRQLLSNIQHELRTPLVAILGYSEILLEEIDTISKEDIKKSLTSIRDSGKKLHKMIEKFIYFSSIKSNLSEQKNSKKIPEDVQVNTKGIKALLSDLFEEYKDKKVDIDVIDNTICIDKYNFTVMLRELVENALKYSRDDFPVVIRGNEFEGRYFLVIYNRGEAISQRRVSAITSFMQFDESAFSRAGIGAGLLIVKSILESFDGEFRMHIAPDGYTSAEVFLDLTKI